MRDYVLIVDDDADLVVALGLLCDSERIRWQARPACDGAVAEIDGNPPALALVDLSIGVALEPLAQALRAKAVPFVVISGAARAENEAGRLGAAGWVKKPFEMESLVRRMIEMAPGVRDGSVKRE